MKAYRCNSCKFVFKYGWWNVNRHWYPSKMGYRCRHEIRCPRCKERHEITFWQTPFKSKLQFIKEWLSG